MASFAGVRGALTLAGILTLPLFLPDGTRFPARDLVIFLAMGVILLSLLLASVTLPLLTKGLVFAPPRRSTEERMRRRRRRSGHRAAGKSVRRHRQE